jgi:RecB family exonuclease
MGPIDHLSASSLTLYRECPMAFMGRYVYDWPITSPPYQAQLMRLGTAVHHALEAHHTGRDAISALCQFWGSIDIPMAPELFARGIGMIRAYIADESPDPRDVCEQKFTLNIPGVDVPIIGYIDRYRGLMVHEYKTTSSPTWWTQERVNESLQQRLYALALRVKNHGAQITGTCHVLKAINGNYAHETYTVSPNKAELLDCEDSIRATWEDIQSGELRADCKPGKCRFPTRCKDYGYIGTDTAELVLHGWDEPVRATIGGED